MSDSLRDRIAKIIAENTAPEKLPGSEAKEILTGPGTKEAKDAENTGKRAKYPSASGGGPEKLKDPNGSTAEKVTESDSEAKGDSEDEDDEDEKDEKSENPFFAKKKKAKKDEDGEDEEDEKKEAKESYDAQAHIDALFSGGDSLTEDFKSKAKTIFEAALNERENVLREEIAEEYNAILENAIQENYETLAEQLDGYLNYIADEWMDANQVAIERGVRAEISESFLEGLRTLFVEHNFDVPEGSDDIIDQLAAEKEELEDALNEVLENNIELSDLIEQSQKAEIISNIGESLTDVEFDKFLSLAEDISYEDIESYETKLTTIKESYFTNKPKTTNNQDADDANGVITENTNRVNDPLINEVVRLLGNKKNS
jgi:hypothetical protein